MGNEMAEKFFGGRSNGGSSIGILNHIGSVAVREKPCVDPFLFKSFRQEVSWPH